MHKEEIKTAEHIKKYYELIHSNVKKEIESALKAKATGLDVSTTIETTPAADLAERTEQIIGPKGIANLYRKILKEEKDRIKTIFKIFKEMIEGKEKIPDPEKRLEQAIKTALVLATEGVVVAPLDGVPEIKISKNPDGSKYVDIYYAGPIRAAGGTATVLPLILGDYARKLMNLEKYKATEDEVERYVEEVQIYQDMQTRQYKMQDEEVRKIIKNCNVCINGEPTEEREVAIHRDLARISHNRIRGGMCLVLSEGIALKASKILKFAETLNLDWNWLQGIMKIGKKADSKEIEVKPSKKYLEGVAAGRPIFSYPSRIGGFRLRYGRTRATGIMSKAIHPATMHVLDDFIAIATQIKIERPGKSAGITPCNTIEGPIVKLFNDEVIKIRTAEKAKKIKNEIKEILFLGDILIGYGDFKYSAHPLMPSGYDEEQWREELRDKITNENKQEIEKIIENYRKINFEEAVNISKKFHVALHPEYIYYFKAINEMQLNLLIKAEKKTEANKTIIKNQKEIKQALELIGLPHRIKEENILIEGNDSKAFNLFFNQKTNNLMKKQEASNLTEEENILKTLTELSGLTIKDKAGTFIGARMGRPEQSKPREMKPAPHVLFPIAELGGNTRSINKALEKEKKGKEVIVDIALYKCPKCKKIKETPYCNDCKTRTIKFNVCLKCKKETTSSECSTCHIKTKAFTKRKINLTKIVKDSEENLQMKIPKLVKGVKGMISNNKIPEPIEKGFLRAEQDLHVYKDGTIRYELINATLTHFKPKEINVSIEKLKELGYKKDAEGKEIENENQLIELMPQDLIIHENAIEFFLKSAKFIDLELEKFYKMNKIYNYNTKKDVIGTLVLGLAPHTSAGIIGRIIGYTKARCCFAHPYFHQAKRRNIDGDQDSLMLLMDALLNFSHKYLSEKRGAAMDAPIVFTTQLNPTEIDQEVHSMDITKRYNFDFYEKTQMKTVPEAVKVKTVKDILETKDQYNKFYFTHETKNITEGPNYSKYITLSSMKEKLSSQAEIQRKIKAVDTKDSIERVLISHLMPDIIGNTRSFTKQKLRCTKCNTKYRRIPLNGKCNKCGDKGNLVLTIAKGSVKKYLEIAKEITEKYKLSNYLNQRLELVEEEINSIFENDKVKQKSIAEYM